MIIIILEVKFYQKMISISPDFLKFIHENRNKFVNMILNTAKHH
jgi:hypothetical protein